MTWPKAVIFDLDGLLLDSERIALSCFVEALGKFGYTDVESVFLRCIGTNWQGTLDILTAVMGPDFPLERASTAWNALYEQQIYHQPIPLMPGAKALLDALKADSIPLTLATSTDLKKARIKLKNSGLSHYFGQVFGGDMVQKGKPDPALYRLAAENTGLPFKDLLAIEDSENGVRAAHAAGLTVIQVPDLVPPTEAIRRLGHTILPSLVEVGRYLREKGSLVHEIGDH
jgi:HAD superfamily hydrolase (TIGR01509 family)